MLKKLLLQIVLLLKEMNNYAGLLLVLCFITNGMVLFKNRESYIIVKSYPSVQTNIITRLFNIFGLLYIHIDRMYHVDHIYHDIGHAILLATDNNQQAENKDGRHLT